MQHTTLKRVMAVHDLSGLGRSSLMAAVPILSVMGIQACPVPTAVLSSQTSGFTGYSFVDLTESMPAYLRHWQQINLQVDCIYSGFLGSIAQIEIMKEILKSFRQADTLVVIDPVMGDDGALYDTMEQSFVQKMQQLVQYADIITPNLTEVQLLLDKPLGQPCSEAALRSDMEQLSAMGPETVIVTGADGSHGGKYVFSYEKDLRRHDRIPYRELPASYPGTGDIFASVLVGKLVNGHVLHEAILAATEFISCAVAEAMTSGEPVRDGVFLETNLYRLMECQ